MTESAALKGKQVAMDQTELAVRIIEAMIGTKRPVGKTSAEVLRMTDPVMAEGALAAAETSFRYFMECMNSGGVHTELYSEREMQ